MARIKGRIRRRPADWDRFAQWAPGAAMLMLAVIAALLLGAALTERSAIHDAPRAPAVAAPASTVTTAAATRDTDLQLYDVIAARVRAGDGYYRAAVEEQRARGFPVRPGLAVRLPTLAHVHAAIGPYGLMVLAALLGVGTLVAWHYRLRDVAGTGGRLRIILLLVVIGAVTGLKPQYLALHEVWSGLLIALALGLYRPNRWWPAVLAGALALAVRELALPFALLMGALALLRGNRGEALAWGAVVLLFGAALAGHLAEVARFTTPADPASPSWFALRGIGGVTSNVVLSSPLHLLPGWLAAPLALLPLLGWAGWRTRFGETGFLLTLGYALLFAVAGRDNNFYWALMVMPVWFVGLAFVPRALASLWASARGN
ncbi:hypothetical protein GRI62_01160 [Erythrobacter arachoides]|uniref:DUF2029 domain-containing protein n=1 Tax=Aurantiacibacter arachoides TaxID=1850444 RepID=A0A844ZWE5_9SPHN|nr:hypothetical protein [Aurantiacibacter arachoides]MXO92215.1 hypothetical protein [Aurantiacibacter arachoides]GGD58784.1 hypothetical protein GCM10011411_18760 [Aurantiacibacter arachoides]